MRYGLIAARNLPDLRGLLPNSKVKFAVLALKNDTNLGGLHGVGLSHKNRFSNFRLFAPTLKGEKAKSLKLPLGVGANFSDFCLFERILLL
ncbi:MAG: hypothetical protein DA408_02235 [Bacteroidetes bacterium]|nr:MAG: hypothetical protein C7N36_00920 [Bacteroidota bacterium]PTM14629.1 MAG: hypothetical protein DA408_02235 [Bacteroidota bacterium]